MDFFVDGVGREEWCWVGGGVGAVEEDDDGYVADCGVGDDHDEDPAVVGDCAAGDEVEAGVEDEALAGDHAWPADGDEGDVDCGRGGEIEKLEEETDAVCWVFGVRLVKVLFTEVNWIWGHYVRIMPQVATSSE